VHALTISDSELKLIYHCNYIFSGTTAVLHQTKQMLYAPYTLIHPDLHTSLPLCTEKKLIEA
jgi:hypothetical protein